jgi:hypothetical protein
LVVLPNLEKVLVSGLKCRLDPARGFLSKARIFLIISGY